MIRFATPDMLYLLLLIPAMGVLFWLAQRARRRRIQKLGALKAIESLMPDVSKRRVRNKFLLVVAAMVCLVFALARPQSGAKMGVQETRGVEMIIAVDVSNSMLAEDFPPSRLAQTKLAIDRLLRGTEGERVGLVVFAGDAYVQLPVTADRATARRFADRLAPDMVSRQGTAMGAAIQTAAAAFSEGNTESKVLVIVSDGENHEDDALAAATAAAEQGVTIYTIGIGTPEGSPISIEGDYLRDTEGAPVISHLDEKTLQDVAAAGGGVYVRATVHDFGLDEVVRRISAAEGSTVRQPVWEQYNEHFQWFLGAALLFLIIDALMLARKNHLLARYNIFK